MLLYLFYFFILSSVYCIPSASVPLGGSLKTFLCFSFAHFIMYQCIMMHIVMLSLKAACDRVISQQSVLHLDVSRDHIKP